MEEQIIFEKIEAYRQNQLSPAERLEVEKLIETDAQWAMIFEQDEEMHAYLNDPVAQKLEAGLAQLKVENPPKIRRIAKLAYASVAIVALLLLFFWSINRVQPTPDYQSLAMAQFSPYPTYLLLRGGDNDSDSSRMQDALFLYNAKVYPEALEKFQTIDEPKLKPKAQFYMGNIYLSQNRPKAAIEVFEAVLDQSDHLFTVQSQWYIALAYLQVPDSKAKGVAFLEEVAKTETEFALKAKSLLTEIR